MDTYLHIRTLIRIRYWASTVLIMPFKFSFSFSFSKDIDLLLVFVKMLI